MNYKYVAVIPARWESSRFPGKPLADINGVPMIIRVWQNASASKHLERVIIATDDTRIFKTCRDYNAEVVMTDTDHPSGTDRIAQALEVLQIDSQNIMNIQGDEPTLTSELIDKLIVDSVNSEFDIATFVKRIDNSDELFNPSVVKVILDNNSYAIYFSRAVIPYIRDVARDEWIRRELFYKHIGIYLYKKHSLNNFCHLKPTALENSEKLEQLRLLQNGYKYLCIEIRDNIYGIDTPEQLFQYLQNSDR